MKLFLFLLILVTGFGQSATAQSIEVMTYNIRLDTKSDSVNHWPLRSHKVYALIKEQNPDILGVQEALHNQLEDLLKNLPAYEFVGSGRDDGKTKGEYSAILYKKTRFKKLSGNTFWLSESPEIPGSKSWDAAITRVATWATLRDLKTGKEFMIVNTHFDHIGKVARANSAALIKSKVQALRGKLPVIVMGDFNSEPAEAPYQEMVNGTTIALKSARPETVTQGTFSTFAVNAGAYPVIDHIFYSEGWRASEYRVITDNDGTYYPSDHLPVMCRLE